MSKQLQALSRILEWLLVKKLVRETLFCRNFKDVSFLTFTKCNWGKGS